MDVLLLDLDGVLHHFDPDVVAQTEDRHGLEALEVEAQQVLFVDDSPAKLAGAADLGMRTLRYRGAEGVRVALAER